MMCAVLIFLGVLTQEIEINISIKLEMNLSSGESFCNNIESGKSNTKVKM